MRIEIAEHGRMTESGSSLLRLIQNQNMPLLDLLVRESVQNSLDASLPDSRAVEIDISVGSFRSKELNQHLEEAKNSLNKRFPESKGAYRYISIRDKNTIGLTGPVRYDDVVDNQFGNLLKLVYEICKPQQNEGAGGSWGLGKTIYFRVGIGLVFYYSRIKNNGKYHSRLAACLVEDETKKDSMIPAKGGVKRGIAWWGASDGKNKTVPLENEWEINRILSVFSIKPYKNDETGTTVIIPYIDETALLNEVYATNEDKEHKPYWTNKIEEYLPISLQRWYAPRYLNTKYKYGAYLSPSVNGKRLTVSAMLPLFKVIRELYLLSTNQQLGEESFLLSNKAEHYTESISIREVFIPGTSSAGLFSYVKLSTKQLCMTAPDNNKSPYQQITNTFYHVEDGKNTPIVMFTRKPGMVVGYDFDGVWTHRMPRSSENEYIIGLFVANSENRMKEILAHDGQTNISLEEYIRQGEKADHASWSDMNIKGINPRVISRIQTNIIKKVSLQYKEKLNDIIEKKNIGLGHALANILLPAMDFGKASSKPPVKTGGGGKGGTRKASLKLISDLKFNEGIVSVDFEIKTKNKPCVLQLLVASDFKRYNAFEWEDEVEKMFPLSFVNIEFTKINKENLLPPKIISEESQDLYLKGIEIRKEMSAQFGVLSQVYIKSEEETILMGVVSFRSSDPSIKGILEIMEERK